MEEKTLGQVAYEAYEKRAGIVAWQAVADAVIAAHEARRWKAIESAPKGREVLCGKWYRGTWIWKATQYVDIAIEDGYTHWSHVQAPPAPAPPKEVERA